MAETPVEVAKTELDELLGEIGEVRSFVNGKIEEDVAPLREEMERMSASIEKFEANLKDARKAKILKVDEHSGLKLKAGRYAGLDTLALGALLSGAKDLHVSGQHLGEGHPLFEEARTSIKNIRDSITYETVDEWVENAIRMRAGMSGKAMGHPAVRQFAQQAESWGFQMREAVRKAMDSTTAGSGDELVPTFEAAQLWMDVNLDTLVLPVLQQFAMPTNPYDYPLQLGDTDWYPITQNVQATTTDVSTAKKTLTAYGLKTGVPFSDELQEDSIVNFAAELRSGISRNAAEVIDDVLLNGDTTTTNNINADGTTISATDAGKAQWLLGFDGLRHISLVDNTGQGTAHNAVVSAAAYNAVLNRMGKYGIPRRAGEVVYITDATTRISSLAIAELETTDSGMGSTLSSGELSNIYGNPIIVSGQMRLSAADGKVTDPVTAAANTEGSILGVNTSQYAVGFRRGITMETEREAGKGQTTMYVSFRIAFIGRNTASSDTATALQYDIT